MASHKGVCISASASPRSQLQSLLEAHAYQKAAADVICQHPTCENLVGKWLPFQFHNNELHCIEFLRAPLVIVSSLQRKLRNYLVHVKMDETSFNQEHTPLRVLSGSKRLPFIVSCRSATTTLLVCRFAQGTSLPQYLIFKGKNFTSELPDGCLPGSRFKMTDS